MHISISYVKKLVMKSIIYGLPVALVLLFSYSQPEKPQVFFQNLKNGDTLTSPVKVEMGVLGLKVEPAGKVRKGYGHHHLLVNQTYIPQGRIVPNNDTTFHYGKGQTVTEISLLPGKYTLSLQFADGVHSSYGRSLSTSIQVNVEKVEKVEE